MRPTVVFLTVGVLVLAGFVVFNRLSKKPAQPIESPAQPASSQAPSPEQTDNAVSVIATKLTIPWEIAFDNSDNLYLTERTGRVLLLKKGELSPKELLKITDVATIGEGGLLGLTLHPQFEQNGFLYVYHTYKDGGQVFNKVVRLTKNGERLSDPKTVIDKIPGAANHNGGRVKFGPDGFLYITTGDAQKDFLAQDKNSLAGKILRLKDDGSNPADNPFGNAIYSLGHRNPQGLAWDEKSRLWSTEHGRSGLRSGLDELNLIEKGKNYGWPNIEGDESREGFTKPIIHSGPNTTWAPSGAAYLNGSVFFAGLRGQTLYEAKIIGDKVELKTHLQGTFGRLRTVVVGREKFLYIATSNRDGRGAPKETDDQVIRLNSEKLPQ